MSSQWFVSRGTGDQRGPFSSPDIRRMADSGQLRPKDRLRKKGTDRWVFGYELEGLFPPERIKSSPTEALPVLQEEPVQPTPHENPVLPTPEPLPISKAQTIMVLPPEPKEPIGLRERLHALRNSGVLRADDYDYLIHHLPIPKGPPPLPKLMSPQASSHLQPSAEDEDAQLEERDQTAQAPLQTDLELSHDAEARFIDSLDLGK